jgi:hypothetical protein
MTQCQTLLVPVSERTSFKAGHINVRYTDELSMSTKALFNFGISTYHPVSKRKSAEAGMGLAGENNSKEIIGRGGRRLKRCLPTQRLGIENS